MAALTGYELRADERRPVLESPDYDVHFIRNETQGDELLYVLRDCPAAMNPARQPKFFLHVRPVDTNDLPAYRRRHGFDNRDFRTRWATHAEARTAVFAFIEGWCNTRRRHSSLGYLSPLAFERLHETAPAAADQFGKALAPTSRFAADAPPPAGGGAGVAAGNIGRA